MEKIQTEPIYFTSPEQLQKFTDSNPSALVTIKFRKNPSSTKWGVEHVVCIPAQLTDDYIKLVESKTSLYATSASYNNYSL